MCSPVEAEFHFKCVKTVELLKESHTSLKVPASKSEMCACSSSTEIYLMLTIQVKFKKKKCIQMTKESKNTSKNLHKQKK